MNRPLSTRSFIQSPQRLRLALLFALLVAIMQFSDPLGDVSLADAVLFWTVRLVGAATALVLAEWLVSRYLANMWSTPSWLKPTVVTMLIAVLPMTAVEVGLERLIPPNEAFDDSEWWASSPLLAVLSEYLTILTIVLPLNFLLWVFVDQRNSSVTSSYEEPTFLAKTGGLQAADVIALEAAEHYVIVWTIEGSEMVYCRLSDAIAEMPASLGLQVHRSWWVSESAVAGANRGERRYQLQLSNGKLVPVSDRYLSGVRERGLLSRKSPIRKQNG